MTDLIAEQEAMLERLLKRHFGFYYGPRHKALARELLLAVQERDAKIIRGNVSSVLAPDCNHECHEADAELIEAQTYADLFLKEE